MRVKKQWIYTSLVTLMALFAAFSYVFGEAAVQNAPGTKADRSEPQSISFKVNSFTHPETDSAFELPVRTIPGNFELAADQGDLRLYLDKVTLAFMVENKINGYVWSSTPSDKILQEASLNDEWRSAIESPLLIEYFNQEAMLQRGSMASLGGRITEIRDRAGGVRAVLQFEDIQASVTIEIYLEDGELIVAMPSSGILEAGDNKLASLQPYPFLGAVYKGDIPGYLFIPDGSGALIRFQDHHPRYDEPYRGTVYYNNDSIGGEVSWSDPLLVPVFGMVHGAEQNSYLGIIEEGKYNAQVVAYPSGVNTDFYWVSASFLLRQSYFQPTSKNMGGFNTFETDRDSQDHKLRYAFLSGNDADYVGMAKTYRAYLMERGMLSGGVEEQEDAPLLVEVLGAEIEPGLIGSKLVKMTSFKEARKIYESLHDQGIKRMIAVYQGWSEGGFTGRNPGKFPAEDSLGGDEGLKVLRDYLGSLGIPLYLYTDYTEVYEDGGGFKVSDDAVRRPSNDILDLYFGNWFISDKLQKILRVNYLNPDKAVEIAADDAERFEEMGIGGIAIDKTPNKLFSDYNPDHKTSRQQTAEAYDELAAMMKERLGSLALYHSNEYLWKHADHILNIPMYSSQYMHTTDTVPFLQIVLHGKSGYFAPAGNFYANPREEMLRLIEYGAYPSYYLTYEPSWKLKDTPSNYLFTSQYQDWIEDIKESYKHINSALKHVQSARIEDRNMPDWGVVEVKYSNGVTILVNYTGKDVAYGGLTAKAQDFAVGGVPGE